MQSQICFLTISQNQSSFLNPRSHLPNTQLHPQFNTYSQNIHFAKATQLQKFNSTSHAKPQRPPCHQVFVSHSPFQIDNSSQRNTTNFINYSSLVSPSLNNDSYSGFFSGTSLSQSEFEDNALLTREETKFLKKQKIGCSSSECTICFESYTKGEIIRNLPCGHKFHYKCMKPWLKTSKFCPLCRFDLKTFCKNKLAESQEKMKSESVKMEIEADCSPLDLSLIKEVKEPNSRTFLDLSDLEKQRNVLNEEINLDLEDTNKVTEVEQEFQNEKELRFRVMGFETESNVSFFGKKHEKEEINFGIEDHISEIGF